MTKSLRGINLGGWLVVERWMTPELFRGVKGDSEIDLVRELGYEQARRRLEQHREGFVKEDDFAWMAKQGFECVRIPVGYWLFESTDEFIDGERYLQRAFLWAKQYRIKVILDFHALQGSQNGKRHSGQSGRIRFYQLTNMRRGLRTLEHMASRYGGEASLIGIEVMNEPEWPRLKWRLAYYYKRAYEVVERHTAQEVRVIFSDGFRPVGAAKLMRFLKLTRRGVLDVHLYQVFSTEDEQKTTAADYLNTVRYDWDMLLEKIGQDVTVMVGEWSVATARNVDQTQFQNEYFGLQSEVFSASTWVHCYWSYRTSGRGAWNYRSLHEEG